MGVGIFSGLKVWIELLVTKMVICTSNIYSCVQQLFTDICIQPCPIVVPTMVDHIEDLFKQCF